MTKLKIGLFGFGKTGRLVANELINHEDTELVWVVKQNTLSEFSYASRALGINKDEGTIIYASMLNAQFYSNNLVDIIIDFSNHKGVYEYLDAAIEHKIKIISAISNYEESDLKALKTISNNSAVIHSPNITLGVNLLMVAAKIFQNIIPNADIEIIEEHFSGKIEVSGTAKRIANYLEISEANNIKSIRAGGIVGKHEVIFGLASQTLRVIHESINRSSFGQGAIFAAQWIANTEQGFYTMEEIIIELFRTSVPANVNK